MSPKLGIIAGSGPLPGYVIAACRAHGRPFFVLALEGFAEADVVSDVPHAWCRMGAGGKGIDLLKQAGAEELVMIGPVKRPSLGALRPDAYTAKVIAKLGVAALGDDGILQTVRKQIESHGFRFVGVEEILADLLAIEGPYGKIQPDERARVDIERGVEVARELGGLDVGQAVVVQQGIVLGVEAIEGTDALLARCDGLRREGAGGVLVKLRKQGQDRRIDLPTIGVTTVENAARAGLRGIAVEAGGALVVDHEKVAQRADKAKLFVVGIRLPGADAA